MNAFNSSAKHKQQKLLAFHRNFLACQQFFFPMKSEKRKANQIKINKHQPLCASEVIND